MGTQAPSQSAAGTGTGSSPHPTLKHPPIVEVVCGWLFDPLPSLDVLRLGSFCETRLELYPEQDVLPPLGDTQVVMQRVKNMRAMLTSADQAYLLQAQFDRFFVNWRSVGGTYPSFNGGGAPSEQPFLQRALEEFRGFGDFCAERLGSRPEPRRVEVTKVNIIERGKHWVDREDLEHLLPITRAPFTVKGARGTRELAISLIDRTDERNLTFSLQSLHKQQLSDMEAVKLETRVVRTIDSRQTSEEALCSANAEANDIFFSLVTDLARFENSEGTSS